MDVHNTGSSAERFQAEAWEERFDHERFEGSLDQVAELLGRREERDRAILAQDMLHVDQRHALASQVATFLQSERAQLEEHAGFQHMYLENGNGDLTERVKQQFDTQILEEGKRDDLADSIAHAILLDPSAKRAMQERFPDLPWDADEKTLTIAVEQEVLGEFSRQADELKHDLELQATILAEHADVQERLADPDKKSLMRWANEKVRSIVQNKYVKAGLIVGGSVLAVWLIGMGAGWLIEFLRDAHAIELAQAGEGIQAVTEGGGALSPTTGLTGPEGSVTGGAGGAPTYSDVWIGNPVR